jgi:hypothetical protein
MHDDAKFTQGDLVVLNPKTSVSICQILVFPKDSELGDMKCAMPAG